MYKWVIGFLLVPLLHNPVSNPKNDGFVINVSATTDSTFYSALYVNNKLTIQLVKSKSRKTSNHPDLPRATIEMGKKEYVFDSYSHLFDKSNGKEILLSSGTKSELEKSVETVEKKHYGELLPWESMQKKFSRMSYARIIDLETGDDFWVQRRAGSRHADVQPLTKADTVTMKRIYQGEWSWRRRAILVSLDGKNYAASMHGMPHGAGAIRGNDFPGHFCVHFLGSSTHKRSEPDPSHSLMILKASGGLNNYLKKATPSSIVDTFLISLNEHDNTTLKLITDAVSFPFAIENLSGINYKQKQKEEEGVDLLTAVVPVDMSYYEKGSGSQMGTWLITVQRKSLHDRWKISDVQVMLIE